jgi:hypothetical protein
MLLEHISCESMYWINVAQYGAMIIYCEHDAEISGFVRGWKFHNHMENILSENTSLHGMVTAER